jgi:hypothetical protein
VTSQSEEQFLQVINNNPSAYLNYLKIKLDSYYSQLERAKTMEEVFRAQGRVAVIKDFIHLADKD